MPDALRHHPSFPSDDRLARIAELVGCPVETFRQPDSGALGDALELVKLWERIDGGGRARLLACARAEAARAHEQAHEQAQGERAGGGTRETPALTR